MKSHVLNIILERLRSEAKDEYQGIIQSIMDSGDFSVAEQTEGGVLSLIVRETQQLNDINDALARIRSGEYGRCIDCGEWIEAGRLVVMPQAARCLKDQSHWEEIQKV